MILFVVPATADDVVFGCVPIVINDPNEVMLVFLREAKKTQQHDNGLIGRLDGVVVDDAPERTGV
jgi:hypothetical protein